jgi:hypothetical protein
MKPIPSGDFRGEDSEFALRPGLNRYRPQGRGIPGAQLGPRWLGFVDRGAFVHRDLLPVPIGANAGWLAEASDKRYQRRGTSALGGSARGIGLLRSVLLTDRCRSCRPNR